jgi:hypothetical protein
MNDSLATGCFKLDSRMLTHETPKHTTLKGSFSPTVDASHVARHGLFGLAGMGSFAGEMGAQALPRYSTGANPTSVSPATSRPSFPFPTFLTTLYCPFHFSAPAALPSNSSYLTNFRPPFNPPSNKGPIAGSKVFQYGFSKWYFCDASLSYLSTILNSRGSEVDCMTNQDSVSRSLV